MDGEGVATVSLHVFFVSEWMDFPEDETQRPLVACFPFSIIAEVRSDAKTINNYQD